MCTRVQARYFLFFFAPSVFKWYFYLLNFTIHVMPTSNDLSRLRHLNRGGYYFMFTEARHSGTWIKHSLSESASANKAFSFFTVSSNFSTRVFKEALSWSRSFSSWMPLTKWNTHDYYLSAFQSFLHFNCTWGEQMCSISQDTSTTWELKMASSYNFKSISLTWSTFPTYTLCCQKYIF